jgi:acyl-CoA synthetase (AMP-forming)/AMP-acid ligase II
MKHVFDLSKPKLIIASSLVIGKVMKVAKSLDYVKGLVLLGDESSYDDEPFVTLMRDYLVDYDVGNLQLEPVDIRNQVSVILCSSGTTGLPKGVQISQFNLMAALEMVQESLLKALSIPTKGLSALLILPMFHAYAFLTTFSVILTAGCQLVILPKFEDRKFLATIEMYKIGLTFLVPPLMVFLAKSDLVLKYDLSSLKEIVVGAAPLKASTEIAVKKRFNNGLIVRQV